MNEFLQKMLAELNSNKSVSSEPLVKMIVESANKSIALGENVALVSANLKTGLAYINKTIKNPELSTLLTKFNESANTPEAKVTAIAKEVNLLAKITLLKESNAYSNPLVKTKIDSFESYLNKGAVDFAVCASFINMFEQYNYDVTIKKCVASVKQYVNENQSKLAVLNTIYQMDSLNSPVYAGVSSDLKSMLINDSYTADILKVKYGTTVPAVSILINDLLIIESTQTGNFTLGEGNFDTKISNLISPAIQTADGLLVYTDNRFLSIREANGLLGNESKVHLDGAFKIAEVDPNYVKTAYGNFYDLCEAYATLGFAKSDDGLGVESKSIRNFKLGFKVNEEKGVDLYVNGSKVGTPNAVNVSEALALENNMVKTKVSKIIENTNCLFNFDFIKEISNDRTMTEAVLVKLNEKYFICEKVNTSDRVWNEVNELEMFEFFKNKFNYDISPIFGTEINKEVAKIMQIEEKKRDILANIEKLEGSAKKLTESCANTDLNAQSINKLEDIRESVEKTINNLKEEFIRIDLLKKKELA